MSRVNDLFTKIYALLHKSIYNQNYEGIRLYDTYNLYQRSGETSSYKMPYALLTIYQAGAIAFQTMLNIEGQKEEDIQSLSQMMLRDAFKFEPVKSYIAQDNDDKKNYNDFLHHISFPEIPCSNNQLWQDVLHHISHTPLASVWALFIPFLEKAFIKGLCPFSFYYHVTLSPDPERIINLAHHILNSKTCFQENKPIPITYAIFKNIHLKGAISECSQIDSLTEIIKIYCEKE